MSRFDSENDEAWLSEPGKGSPATDELVLELDIEPKPEAAPEQRAENSSSPVSAFTGDSAPSAAFAPKPKSPIPHPAEEPKFEARVLSQTYVEAESGPMKPILIAAIFGLIGALCFAGISAFYFSIGRRAGMLAVAFFAALGAKMGTNDVRGTGVRWTAAFTAAGSAIAGKAILVFLLFQMYSGFTAEDWTNFADPGKSNAIYFEQGIENALSTDSTDMRSGQEKLDDKFEKEFIVEGSAGAEEEGSEEEEVEVEVEAKPLAFGQVFPKMFDVFDLPLIIASMIFAYRMARHGD